MDKMRFPKISILGFLTGTTLFIGSFIRWYIIYYDLSQAVLGMGVGLLGIILSYIYSFMKGVEETLRKHEKRLDSIASWFMKEEETTIKAQARGLE